MTTSYQEQTSGTLPDWNTQIMGLLNLGKTQAGAEYQPYAGQLTAGLTPQQQAAFQQASSSVGNWKPELNQAGQLIGQSASNPLWGQANAATQQAAGMNLAGIGSGLYGQAQQGIQGAMGMDLAGIGSPLYGQAANMFSGSGQFDPNQVGQYLNPYLSGVVGEIGRLGNEQFQNQVLPGLTSAFSGLGQHGSARQAMMMSDAAARNQREVLGQQATALNTGYTNAMGDYLNWAKQGQASAQGLAGLGGQMYNQALGQANLGLQGANALQGLGAQQYTQGLGQANLGLAAGEQFGSLAGQQSGAQLAAGQGLGNLAQARQQLSIGDYGQLLNAGTIQQQQQQKELDAQYEQWNKKQQYPWEQLGNYAKLFGAGTPQQSTNWSASFKKGGLARYADGGDFRPWDHINFDTEHDQPARDELRLQLLMQELEDNPDDVDLLSEIKGMGVPLEDISIVPNRLNSAEAPSRLPELADSRVVASPGETFGGLGNLARRSFDARVAALERLRRDPSMQPIPERSTLDRIARGLFASSAEGPAHWGTLLGRTGAAYYGDEDIRQRTNRDLAVARAGIEDKLIPEMGRGWLGSGSMPGYVSVIGQDGKRYMVNRLDPNDRIEIGTGVNRSKLHEAADRYAREQNKDSIFKTDAEREARYNYHKQQYIDNYYKQQYIGARTGKGSMFPEVPGSTTNPGRAYDPASYGSAEKKPPIDESGKVILSPSEEEQQKKIGASEGARYDEMQKVGSASRGQLNTLNFLEKNLDQISTGKLTPLKTEVKAWASSFGIDLGEEDIPPAQAVKAISGQLALTLRNTSEGNGMPGALSDRDLAFLQSMVPNLGNDPESNKLIIKYSREIAQRNADVAQKARDYIQKNSRGVLDAGFYGELKQWAEKNPLFKDEQQSARKQFDEMPDASLYDGKRLKGDDGTIYRSVNGKWVKE